MSEVVEAIRTGPGGFRMPVALKRLHADAAIRGEAVQRFFAEARILSRLDHPNIVRVLDVLAVDAGSFIVMELLRGCTVAELVAQARAAGAPVAWPRALAIADQALAGLAYAHAAADERGRALGLVHRDVTPRNLLVTDGGVVKLLDFGLAKLHEGLDLPITRDGIIQGTLELLAPEQALGDPIDAATDLYQLGATLYWALGGRFPHGTGTTAELVARAVHVTPTPLAELRGDLPAPVVALVERAMARDRAARFPSATAMREAVHAALAESPCGAAELAAWVALLPRPVGDDHADQDTVAIQPAVERVTDAVAGVAAAAAVRAAPRPRTRRWIAAGIAAAAVVAATVAVVVIDRDPAPAAVAPPREVVLTMLAGDEQPVNGSISPDGTRLAYATGARLVVRGVAGGSPEPVAVFDGFYPLDVEFFPDSRGLLVTGQAISGEFQLWEIAGSATRVLTAPERFEARIAPDGRHVALASRTGIVVVPLHAADATPRTIVTLAPGEIVMAVAWSPDSRRLAFVRTPATAEDESVELVELAGGEPQVVRRRPFGTFIAGVLAWVDAGRLIYAVGDRDGTTLFELSLAGVVERVRHRWPGLGVTNGRFAGGRLVYLRGTSRYGMYVGDPTTRPRLDRVSTGGGVVRRIAGWIDGALVFAGDAAGTYDVVTLAPGDRPRPWITGPDDDRPDTLADGAVLFQRARADGVVELWRGTADGDRRRLATVPAAGAAANVVRCAADRTPPCVFADAEGTRVRYVVIDPVTGARGPVIAELPAENHYLRNHAVSPDGAIVAVVDGTSDVALFDVATGARRTLPVGGGVDLQSVSWSLDGRAVLVTGIMWRGRTFATLSIDLDGAAVAVLEFSYSRWLWRAQPAPDGRIAAIGIDYANDLAMLEGL